jgi:hypothetical protein
MGRETNNYNSLMWPKSVDNTHRLSLNAFRFQPPGGTDVGDILVVDDVNGEIVGAKPVEVFDYRYTVHVGPTEPETDTSSTSVVQGLALAKAISATLGGAQYVQILVQPGFYYETAQLVWDDGSIVLRGQGDYNTTFIILVADIGALPFIECSVGGIFNSLTIIGGANCDYVLRCTEPPGSGFFTNLVHTELYHGRLGTIYVDNTTLFILWSTVLNTQFLGGNLISLVNGASFNGALTFYINPGGNAVFYLSGGSSMGSNNSQQNGATYSIDCDASTVTSRFGIYNGCTVGLRADNASTIRLVGEIMTGVVTTDLEVVDDDTQMFATAMTLSVDKLILPPTNPNIIILSGEINPDNTRGYKVLGELSVGTVKHPDLSYFGEGGPNSDGEVVLKSTDDITFTDVSADIVPSGAGSVTMYDSLATGYFYVGGDNKFGTVEFDVGTVETGGIGNHVWEFWDGAVWTEFSIMATDANSPYASYAHDGFTNVHKEDIRFDHACLLGTKWQTTSVDGVTKYWVRRRLTAAITQSSILSDMLIVGNTTIIEKDGQVHMHGLARSEKLLQYDITTAYGLSGSSRPSDDDFWYSTALGVGRRGNGYDEKEETAMVINVPFDFDSSSSVRFLIMFAMDTNDTNAFDLDFTYATITLGDPVYFSSGSYGVHANERTLTATITPNQTDGTYVASATVLLTFPEARASDPSGNITDILVIKINRPVTGQNGAKMVVFNWAPYYIAWRESGTVRT